MEGLRLPFFLISLLVFGCLEQFFGHRKRIRPIKERWLHNLSLSFFYSLALKLFFPLGLAGFSALVIKWNYPGLHVHQLPPWLEIPFTLLLFDFIIYWQHRFFHRIEILWRLHRTHHLDLDLDVTSGIRFHPIEIFASFIIKLILIFIIGPRPESIILFEIVLSSCALFNHANIKVPSGLEAVLRPIVITPELHRIHHSIVASEMNSNFGFSISLWDRLFKSLIDCPKNPHETMPLGIKDRQQKQNLRELISDPFRNSE